MTPEQEKIRNLFCEAYERSHAFLSRESSDKEGVTECADQIHRAIWAYVGMNFGLKLSGWGPSQPYSATSISVVPKSREAIAALERLERPTSDDLWDKSWLEMPPAAFVALRDAAEEAGTPLPDYVIKSFPFIYAELSLPILPGRSQIVSLIPRAKEIWRTYARRYAGRFDRDHVLSVLFLAYRLLTKTPTRKGVARFVLSVEDCYGELFCALDPDLAQSKDKSIFGGLNSKETLERVWQQVERIDALAG